MLVCAKREANIDFFFFNKLEACINGIYLPAVELHEHLMTPTDRMSTDEKQD